MDERQATSSVSELLERLIREAENQDHENTEGDIPPAEVLRDPRKEPTPPASGGGALGGLLSNPALMAALPQLLQGIGSLSGGGAASAADRSSADKGKNNEPPTIKPTVSDRHTALLCALKPYLGTSRREAVGYLISLCRVWDTLQGMGLNLPALLSSAQGTNSSEGGRDDHV